MKRSSDHGHGDACLHGAGAPVSGDVRTSVASDAFVPRPPACADINCVYYGDGAPVD